MKDKTTENIVKIRADAEALYDLFQIYGRGRVTEESFVFMYIKGELPKYIEKVVRESQGGEE